MSWATPSVSVPSATPGRSQRLNLLRLLRPLRRPSQQGPHCARRKRILAAMLHRD